MTSKEKPLAGAVQARQQGASNICPQNTHSSTAGQGKQSSKNSACRSASISIVKVFLILYGQKVGIALGEVRV